MIVRGLSWLRRENVKSASINKGIKQHGNQKTASARKKATRGGVEIVHISTSCHSGYGEITTVCGLAHLMCISVLIICACDSLDFFHKHMLYDNV